MASDDSAERVRVGFLPDGRSGEVEAGTTLRDAARTLGLGIESICGGRGTCAKCKVRVLDGHFDEQDIDSLEENVSLPSGAELRAREPELSFADWRIEVMGLVNGEF